MKRLAGLRLPISTRLTLWYGLTLLALLSLFAVFCYTNFHLSLHRDFDRHLTHEKRELLPFVEVERGRPSFTGLSELRSVAYQTDGIYGTFVRLLSPTGEVVYHSPNFDGHEPLPVGLPEKADELVVSRAWENKPSRSRYTPLMTQAGELAGWLEVTGFEWSLHQELHRLALTLILGILISMVLAIGGGYWMARRALRPVAALTHAASRISSTDLSARLPADFWVRDELSDLAETINEMVARLEKSFQRERRFTSNAAHELLTPLATMRNEVEVTLRREREAARYQRALQAMLTDIDRLTDTVRGLLRLAQAERHANGPTDAIDLSALCEEHVRRHADRAQGKGILLDHAIEPGLCVRADAVPLGEALDNLLDNALKYTPSGGQVCLEATRSTDAVHVRVWDTGAGFDPATADHLFDRFYRADMPEVQRQPGSGLGLSIVRAVVQGCGGAVTASSAGAGAGSTFTIRLPLATVPIPGRAAL